MYFTGIATLLNWCGDGFFGGLGVLAALLWFIGAGCAALGYGMTWLIFFMSKGRGNKGKKSGGNI